ncbi:MAG: DUF5320 domain-containing protein [Chloroflexi bacterium]|nr:DUF5320 domain-containing protein [Chloroflexota bacterium]
MPGGDRTGPRGLGPMTGRGAGYCAGYKTPGYANPWGGRFFGRGAFGGGRGHRHWFYATGQPRWARFGYGAAYPGWNMPPAGAFWGAPPAAPAWTPEQEAAALKEQAEMLGGELEAIQKRLAELENAE